ncbi:unnamed protein product, partial [Mesorhabditis spiculigera]
MRVDQDSLAPQVDYYRLVVAILALTLAIPTFVIAAILTKHFFRGKLNTVFTKICYFAVVADLLGLLLDLVAWDFASMGLLRYYEYISSGFIPTILSLGQLASRKFQMFCCVLIAFNRLTVLSWRQPTVKKFWQHSHCPLLLIGLAISLVFLMGMALHGARFERFNTCCVWILRSGRQSFVGL